MRLRGHDGCREKESALVFLLVGADPAVLHRNRVHSGCHSRDHAASLNEAHDSMSCVWQDPHFKLRERKGIQVQQSFCMKCGKPLMVDARFCMGCGTASGTAPNERSPV